MNKHHANNLIIFFITLVLNATSVTVTAPGTQTVGQSLLLECSVVTARGITPRVDIVWSRDDGDELLRILGVTATAVSENVVEYLGYYNISVLSTLDDDRTYHCAMIITDDPPVISVNTVTLDVTGMHVYANCIVNIKFFLSQFLFLWSQFLLLVLYEVL